MASTIRDDDGVTNPSTTASLTDLVERAIAQSPSRRSMLKSGLGLAALSFMGISVSACGGGDDDAPATGNPGASNATF